jgi:hypothetical protein
MNRSRVALLSVCALVAASVLAAAPATAAQRTERIILGVRPGVDARALIRDAGGSVT